jgi:KaiC/GvpD/RAD55 family RecA-like ATPase
MTTYKAIAIGLNQRELVEESKLRSRLLELYDKQPNKDYYVSVFKYNQNHFNLFKQTKSLAGITDNKASSIVFDFDDDANIDNAKKDAVKVVERLEKDGITSENINIYFSGGKGFHLEVNTNEEFSREELINIREVYSGDLESTDSVIKDNQRILRSVFSKHNETGLYKIPLTFKELKDLSVKDIKMLAADPDDSRYDLDSQKCDIKINTPQVIKNNAKPRVKEKVAKSSDKIDFSKNKTGLTNAKYALSQGYFDKGERHEAVMILAATFMGLGWHQELTYNNIKATMRLRANRLGLSDLDDAGKSELWHEVSSVYSPTWKGGMYSDDKNPLLIKTKKLYGIEDRYDSNLLVNLPEINNIFADFAKNIDKNTLKLGIPSFDAEIRVTTSTLVSILAAPSAGKSSISFGILNSTSKEGIRSMFFSLDMAAPQVYQRLAQRHTGYHSDRLFQAYQKGERGVIEQVEETLSEEYKNVKFCFRGAMNIDIIREAILKEKDLTGDFPKLVVIDYLENVMTDLSNDPTIAKGFVARSLKDIANEFGICVILLTQPAKVSGGPSEELNSYYNIKGSGLVAEASAQVITMHRPGFDPKYPEDDNFITLTVVKNRMGTLGTFDYHWEGVRGTIRELSHEEEATLKKVREANVLKKQNKGDDI